MNRKSNF